MIKSVHEFIKIFSFLFLLSGIFFLTQSMFLLGAMGLITFAVIKILDSDWAFDTFKFSNHNFVVTIVTFALIFLNVFYIYQEMKYSSLFNKVDETTTVKYLEYENELFSIVKPCANAHNDLIESLNSKQPITRGDIKNSHDACYAVLPKIQEQQIPDAFPNEVKKLCIKNKDEIKNLAAVIADFDYAKKNSQSVKLKENFTIVTSTLKKIRETMQLPSDDDSIRKSFIKF